MLMSSTLTITIKHIEYNIFFSPFSLHIKEVPKFKDGKIEKLFFYNNLKDQAYSTLVKQHDKINQFESDDCVLNLGQDFGKYYLGSSDIDTENKVLSNWQGNLHAFTTEELALIADALFNPNNFLKPTRLFTPTTPSAINLTFS